MIEQWFLDLDGVRSGPYQTPEVMSLIAEGEVLPHHRIATGLREQNWRTILDWRLDQAKTVKKTIPQTPVTSTRVSEISSVAFASHSEPDPSPLDEWKSEPLLHETAPPAVAVPTSSSTPIPEVTIETAKSVDSSVDSSIELFASPDTDSVQKRDAMAEMFEMLQKSKQKREAKQNQANANDITIEDVSKRKGTRSNIARTLAIGLGITIVGFILGQLFQQAAPPPEPVAAKPSPASNIAASPAMVAVDRSNDKLTIKGMVPKTEATPAPPKMTTHTSAAETPQTERELEELRTLKKELQELKNMKSNSVDADSDSIPDANDPDGRGDPNNDPNYQPDVRPDGSQPMTNPNDRNGNQ